MTEKSLATACDRVAVRRGVWWFNTHGSKIKGIPDRAGAYRGRPLFVEFKIGNTGSRGGSSPWKLQKATLAKARKAGAIAVVIRTREAFAALLDSIDEGDHIEQHDDGTWTATPAIPGSVRAVSPTVELPPTTLSPGQTTLDWRTT